MMQKQRIVTETISSMLQAMARVYEGGSDRLASNLIFMLKNPTLRSGVGGKAYCAKSVRSRRLAANRIFQIFQDKGVYGTTRKMHRFRTNELWGLPTIYRKYAEKTRSLLTEIAKFARHLFMIENRTDARG